MEQALTAAVMPPRPHGECEVMHYLLSYSQLVQLLRVGAWTVKPLKDTFASRQRPFKIFDNIIFPSSVKNPVPSCGQRTAPLGEADVEPPQQWQLLFAGHSWSQVLLPHPCCAQGGAAPLAGREPGYFTGCGGRSVPCLHSVIHNSTCQYSR